MLSERSHSEKGYVLSDSNSVTFWKRQNYADRKNTGFMKMEEDEQVQHRTFLGH